MLFRLEKIYMEFFINTFFKIYKYKLTLISFFSLFICSTVHAQARNYSLIYSENIKGGAALFGNTLLQVINQDTINTSKMNDNAANGNSIYGNDNENMKNIDIDGNTGNGSGTINSSSADLILPAGNNTIKFARLYWGGRIRNSDFDLTDTSHQTIKIRKDTLDVYTNVIASGIDKILIVSGYTQYQAYADITDFVKNNGAGTYEVGNVPLTTGAIDNGGNNGGWCIVVVYANDVLNYNSIRIYDGFQQVYNNGNPQSTTVTLSGLNVPSNNLTTGDATMGALVWEGDANLTGDYLKINDSLFSNAINPIDNPWNGTITNNGIHVSSKNPNYTNQMGLDIDEFNVGAGYNILPNANSVKLEFGTTADKYFPGLFTFTIKMKEPENGPLPVTLVSFNVSLWPDKKVKIDWSTSMEINCNKYIIERSFDGNLFSEVAAMPGNGTTSVFHNYSIIDDVSAAISAVVYYRIKQIDMDGKSFYSKIISVKLKNDNEQINISPNPFTNYLHININWNKNEMSWVKVFNAQGAEVLSKNIKMNTGINYIPLDDVSKLSSGNYFIQIISASQKVVQKIVKTDNR